MHQTILFLHLYKTGGQTLRNMVSFQYNKTEYFDIGKNSFEQFLNYKNKSDIKAIFGHIKFGMHKFLPTEKVKYVTLLRNPVERILSLHRYVNQTQDLDLHQIMPPNEREDLYLFMENIDKYSPYHGNNGQCKMIAGIDRKFPKNNLWDELIKNKKTNNNDVFKNAKQNLVEYFLFTGIMEMFDESIILIKKSLGWKKPIFYMRRNKTINIEQKIPDEIIQLIQNKNSADIQLYELVKNKLCELVRTNLIYVRKERYKLKINNWFYSNYRNYFRSLIK